MSSAEGSTACPRPPFLRGSNIVRPPSSSSSPSTAAAAIRHLPFSLAPADRPHLRSSPGGGHKIPPPNSTNKKEIHETEKKKFQSAGAVSQAVKQETNGSELPTGSGTGVKRQRKTKSKNKNLVLHTPRSTDGTHSNPLASNNCRYDSSLGLLTKKFIDLLQKAKDGCLDLNSAAETLEVQKRRIYDITNVLEGVGLIEKTFKNKIRWKGIDMSRPKELDDQISQLKAEIETLNSEDFRLDGMIRGMQENLRVLTEDENNQKWLYLTKEDIISIPSFQDATLIAIKAPHGTSLEVPDPDEVVDFPQRRYQILLRSLIGPIDCYLISNHEDRTEASNYNSQPAATDSCVQSSCSNNDLSQSPTEHDAGMGSEHEDQVTHKILSDSKISHGSMDGIVKIVPSDVDVDADYWLLSDPAFSITNAWRTECILELSEAVSSISIPDAVILT